MNAVEHAVIEEAPQADSPFITVMKLWARWMSLGTKEAA